MNEQKWRLKGTQLVGIQTSDKCADGTVRFHPDNWYPSCWMYAYPDMLEPAAAPAPDLGQRIRNIEEQLGIISNALSDETVLTASGATKEIEAINRRLSALEANLTKESTIFDVWRRAHMNIQQHDLTAIKNRLDALEAKPAPEHPLEVGDEVWVKGTLSAFCPEKGNYRVDFGMGTYWCSPNAPIKRA